VTGTEDCVWCQKSYNAPAKNLSGCLSKLRAYRIYKWRAPILSDDRYKIAEKNFKI
jgi:hypothetical protein